MIIVLKIVVSTQMSSLVSDSKEEVKTRIDEISLLVAGQVDSGKCLHGQTKIMLSTGLLKIAKDIQIGDLLMGDDSKPRKVISVSKGRGKMYKVTPVKGDSYVVNGNHILSLKRTNMECVQWREAKQAWRCMYWIGLNISSKSFSVKKYKTSELAKTEAENYMKEIAPTLPGFAKAKNIVDISVNDYLKIRTGIRPNLKGYRVSVDFDEREVMLEPYMLGLWLGDGTSACPQITNIDSEVDNIFNHALRKYNLILNKHVPDDYKFTSRKIRLEVLAGLLDTDGSFSNGCFTICQKSERLLDDIIFISRSLGFSSYKSCLFKTCHNSPTRAVGQYYQTTITGDIDEIPTKILRKQAGIRKSPKDVLLIGIKIEPLEEDDFYGVELDGNKRFLLHDFTVTHNSSTIGTLVFDELDTKDNPIWKRVDKHRHEQESKHTSSISSHYMKRDDKVVDLVNLCGHLKYLNQTLLGMSGHYADYSMLLVNINRGITEMGLEHLNILVHLNIPFFIVFTKIDECKSVDMYKQAHEQIHKTLRKFNRKAVSLRVDKEYNLTEDYHPYVDFLSQRTDLVPIICISNRTGKNIDKLRDLIFSLKARPNWKLEDIVNDIFFITSVYKVPYVGLVVAGIVKSTKSVKLADTWYLGPYEGRFIPVKIKSAHNDIIQDVDELSNGESGCLCIRFSGKESLEREQILKGSILTNNPVKIMGNVVKEFTARIMVLQHHTTVRNNFECVIHMGPIRQTAVVEFLKGIDNLRTGDVATIKFKWKFRPEYCEVNTRFFCRESSCRMAGEVIALGPVEVAHLEHHEES